MKYFQETDPDTGVTESALTQMVYEGTIPAVKAGSKILINLDKLLEVFGSPDASSKFQSSAMDRMVINK